MDDLCAKCKQPKGASRVKSRLCRKCDGAARARRSTGQKTAMRRLTLELPIAVWDALDTDARVEGQRIAGYVQHMLIKRHGRMVEKYPDRYGASPSTVSGNDKENST